jgi:hypothetical protein
VNDASTEPISEVTELSEPELFRARSKYLSAVRHEVLRRGRLEGFAACASLVALLWLIWMGR